MNGRAHHPPADSRTGASAALETRWALLHLTAEFLAPAIKSSSSGAVASSRKLRYDCLFQEAQCADANETGASARILPLVGTDIQNAMGHCNSTASSEGGIPAC